MTVAKDVYEEFASGGEPAVNRATQGPLPVVELLVLLLGLACLAGCGGGGEPAPEEAAPAADPVEGEEVGADEASTDDDEQPTTDSSLTVIVISAIVMPAGMKIGLGVIV